MRTIKSGGHTLLQQDQETSRVVAEMLGDIERNGMDAVRKYSRRLDGWDPPSFELSTGEIAEAVSRLSDEAVRDTAYCQANVRKFAEAQLATLLPLDVEVRPGVVLGHKHIPVNSVGCYVPGGRYPMFGSAQMSIIPAKVAGVRSVVACTPPVARHSVAGDSAAERRATSGQGYYPATINAMARAGADRIFVLGGVQALAMMAFGLGVVEPVDILCGAGNRFVTEAKRQLFGRVGIDLLAGPTEILVIADDAADPALVACDLLGQAEHDPNSGVCLICTCRRGVSAPQDAEAFARAAIAELEKQLAVLPTRDVAALSWRDNGIVLAADSPEEACALSDDYAPEHLELHVLDTDFYVNRLANYGSLFIGEETTVAYGDKSIGTNHILPTGRAARYTGGLWVGKFLKTCTYQRLTPAASRDIGAVTERQCKLENMLAHAITARVRVERYAE
ncbi:MAG: histidinol dehydrogenase [Planctomycetes bacterium]|nr:histidinol dehydrogenase [Planctomycetota bacterium]